MVSTHIANQNNEIEKVENFDMDRGCNIYACSKEIDESIVGNTDWSWILDLNKTINYGGIHRFNHNWKCIRNFYLRRSISFFKCFRILPCDRRLDLQ